MYRSLFPRDLFAELDRLQRGMGTLFEPSPGIRGQGRGGYPALNVGSTAESVEVYAFAPGLDPASIDVKVERGVLSLTGERPGMTAPSDAQTTVHLQERFGGRFRRVVNLSDDIDAETMAATYRDGVLHVSVKRRAAAQPRRVEVR